MSTLAATKADGFYYPPDWTPEGGVKGSSYRGTHGALGKRANKMKSHGVLTIRFEMPFHVTCGACGHMIAKGVRFNAEKKKIGMYHTTPIWSFTMRSACCSQEIEVQTDPAKTEYNVTKGAERCVGYGSVVDPESTEDAMQMLEYETAEERAAFLANPMAVLERGAEDERRSKTRARTTFELNALSKARWKNDYEANKSLRKTMRGSRKEEDALRDEGRALGLPDHVKLRPEREEDKEYAHRVLNASIFDRRQREKRQRVLSEDIFSKTKRTASSSMTKRTSSSSNHSRAAKLAKIREGNR